MKLNIFKILSSLSFILFVGVAIGQEFSFDGKNIDKLVIEKLGGELILEGSSSSMIVITASEVPEIPERAKGLKPLLSNGVDNTGLGLNYSEVGNTLIISGAPRNVSDITYSIKLPESISFKYHSQSPLLSLSDIHINNFKGEIEIESMNSDMDFSNVSGPLVLHTMNGDMNIDYAKVSSKGPHSISSMNGEIELRIPSSEGVDLEISTMHGEVYTDMDITFDKDKDSDSRGLSLIGGNASISGKLNKGGVKMDISTMNGNVYLRKK